MFKINRRFNVLKCIRLVTIKINEYNFDFMVLYAQKNMVWLLLVMQKEYILRVIYFTFDDLWKSGVSTAVHCGDKQQSLPVVVC